MLRGFSATELATIARNGGGLDVDGSRYTATELAMVARNLTHLSSRLIVSNASHFTATELSTIALNGDGRVLFA